MQAETILWMFSVIATVEMDQHFKTLGQTFFKSPFHFKQLLDEVEHDIMNYQNRGLWYLPKPKAEADNTDTRFW